MTSAGSIVLAGLGHENVFRENRSDVDSERPEWPCGSVELSLRVWQNVVSLVQQVQDGMKGLSCPERAFQNICDFVCRKIDGI